MRPRQTPKTIHFLHLLLIGASTAMHAAANAQSPRPSNVPTVTVSPSTSTLLFQGHIYGPAFEQFDPKTSVWTVRFRSDGVDRAHAAGTALNEILFNFYGWNPAIDPKDIAQTYVAPRSGTRILGKFRAPDAVTRQPAYFVVSETVYPGEPDAFVNIIEITSSSFGAYAVTFSHFVPGENAEQRGKDWFLSAEGQAIAAAIDHFSVDPSWVRHFNEFPVSGSAP